MEKHRKKIIVGIFALSLVIFIVSVAVSGKPQFLANIFASVVIPVQSSMDSMGRFVDEKIESVTKLTELQKENVELQAENAELRLSNSRLESLEKENKRLSELLTTDIRYKEFEKVGAHIIAREPGNWYKSFFINKGELDGLLKNMVVIGDGGLIGRITEVGRHYAKVVAMIDDSSTVSAMGVRTEDIGYIKGDISLMLEGLCRMEFIDEDAGIMEGDEIVTSHLSSLYPPGITIGTVKAVYPDSNGTKYALVEPQVNFEKLEMVLVLTEGFDGIDLDDLKGLEGYQEQ